MINTIDLPTIEEIQAERYKRSLYAFVLAAWDIVEPSVKYVDGWHIHAICETLQALHEGRIPSNNLQINVPPRHMKSLLVNVFFVAWIWAQHPGTKFLCYSYSEDLTIRDSEKCKKLLKSSWYQERFTLDIDPKHDQKSEYINLDGGYRYCFGMGGSLGGHGGDYILIDDPLEMSKAESKAERDKVNNSYDTAISSRGNDPATVKRVIIMQRLHEDDLCGHLAKKSEPWEKLILPAKYEGERFISSIGFADPRQDTDALLWPERFTIDVINLLSDTMGTRVAAGQLQQRPAPLEGNIYKRDWFIPRYDLRDIGETLHPWAYFVSWDTAGSMSGGAAYSSGVAGFLTAGYHLYICGVYRKRLEFPQLTDAIETQARLYPKSLLQGLIIENKSTGISAIQTLRQVSEFGPLVKSFNPKGDKDARGYQAAGWCEKKLVHFPQVSDDIDWMPDFEDEIFNAPNSEFRDQFDALNQLILYLRGYLAEGYRQGR